MALDRDRKGSWSGPIGVVHLMGSRSEPLFRVLVLSRFEQQHLTKGSCANYFEVSSHLRSSEVPVTVRTESELRQSIEASTRVPILSRFGSNTSRG
jgi:hypothetical protein